MALAYLKQAPIASLDEASEKARTMKLFYDPVRLELLRKHDWSFAATTAVLTELDIEPEEKPEAGRAFAYPNNAVWVSCLWAGTKRFGRGKFKICNSIKQARRFLLANVPDGPVKATYTADVKEETLFDPAFVSVLTLALASAAASNLSGSDRLADNLLQKLMLKLDEATLANKQEGFSVPAQSSVFEEVR